MNYVRAMTHKTGPVRAEGKVISTGTRIATSEGRLVDASGKLPDGSTFSGAAGLKQLLLTQHRDEFISTFTEKLMIYALGRGLEPYDEPAVRGIMHDAAKENDAIPALIRAIIESPQFQMRRNRES